MQYLSTPKLKIWATNRACTHSMRKYSVKKYSIRKTVLEKNPFIKSTSYESYYQVNVLWILSSQPLWILIISPYAVVWEIELYFSYNSTNLLLRFTGGYYSSSLERSKGKNVTQNINKLLQIVSS